MTMTRQITLELSDELYDQARSWAALSKKDLTGALTDALFLAFAPLSGQPPDDLDVTALSDRDILTLSQVQMEKAQGEQMDELLRQQSEGDLTQEGQRTLSALVQVYHSLWLRQSLALAESVRRGLRPHLQA